MLLWQIPAYALYAYGVLIEVTLNGIKTTKSCDPEFGKISKIIKKIERIDRFDSNRSYIIYRFTREKPILSDAKSHCTSVAFSDNYMYC